MNINRPIAHLQFCVKLECILIRIEWYKIIYVHPSITTKPQCGADRYLLRYSVIYFPWKYFCHWLTCTSVTSPDISWFCCKDRFLSHSRSAPTTLYVQWNIVNTTDVNIRSSVTGWSKIIKKKTVKNHDIYRNFLFHSFLSSSSSFASSTTSSVPAITSTQPPMFPCTLIPFRNKTQLRQRKAEELKTQLR